jgi:hypothetical protein
MIKKIKEGWDRWVAVALPAIHDSAWRSSATVNTRIHMCSLMAQRAATHTASAQGFRSTCAT